MLWIKAFHIISVISWFAALFYLPRLFVYHAMTSEKSGLERFQIMERKLYRIIGTPAMIATWGFGIALVSFNPEYYLSAGWFHIKFSLVILLSAYHGACGYLMKRLRTNPHALSHKFFRVFNEIPVLFLIAVVLLVVLKVPH